VFFQAFLPLHFQVRSPTANSSNEQASQFPKSLDYGSKSNHAKELSTTTTKWQRPASKTDSHCENATAERYCHPGQACQ
jgi:hypothetical protein